MVYCVTFVDPTNDLTDLVDPSSDQVNNRISPLTLAPPSTHILPSPSGSSTSSTLPTGSTTPSTTTSSSSSSGGITSTGTTAPMPSTQTVSRPGVNQTKIMLS